MKAWKSVLVSVASYSLGLVMIAKAPWYLLPLAWAWTGTAITGVSLIQIFFLVASLSLSLLLILVRLAALATEVSFLPKFFVIGHDCAHKSFSRNKLVEDIVGTLAFMPLIYPYEPWRFKHDQHHAKTNMY